MGGGEKNRWTGGGWDGCPKNQQKFSLGSRRGSVGGGGTGPFAYEKGARLFHLEMEQQDLCHVPEKPQPHSSFVSGAGRSEAINMLH